MKILSASSEELRRRKAEYDAQKAAYDEASDAAWRNWQDALYAITDPIKQELEYNLGKFSTLSFNIDIRHSPDSSLQEHIYRVHIACDSAALSWTYDAYINPKGELDRETSSWSGLKATTSDQIKSLEQTVKALDYLNSIDWQTIIMKKLPDAKSFYADVPEVTAEPVDQHDLFIADMIDSIGQRKMFKVKNWLETNDWNSVMYIIPIKDSGSQLTVFKVPQRIAEDMDDESREWIEKYINHTERIRKDRIYPALDDNHEMITIEY